MSRIIGIGRGAVTPTILMRVEAIYQTIFDLSTPPTVIIRHTNPRDYRNSQLFYN